MHSDPKKRSLPENLVSMQDIRKTPGLTCQVEERMQSVYSNPTLAAAPSATQQSSSVSGGLPPMASLLGAPAGLSISGSTPDNSWVQQQQRELREYQQIWQQQQQLLMNEQLQNYQQSLETQNRKFQEQLQQQFLRGSSGRAASVEAEAAAEKQRTDRQCQLRQE